MDIGPQREEHIKYWVDSSKQCNVNNMQEVLPST